MVGVLLLGLEVGFECVYQGCFPCGLGADDVDVLGVGVGIGILGVIHGVLLLFGACVFGLVWSGLVWSWLWSC